MHDDAHDRTIPPVGLEAWFRSQELAGFKSARITFVTGLALAFLGAFLLPLRPPRRRPRPRS